MPTCRRQGSGHASTPATTASTREARVVIAEDVLRPPVIGNRQFRHVCRQACQSCPHAVTMLGVLAVKSLPERDHDRLRQGFTCFRGQFSGELVRLVALDAECHSRSIDLQADFYHARRLAAGAASRGQYGEGWLRITARLTIFPSLTRK